MAQPGITVSYQPSRLWCNKFGSKYTQILTSKHQDYGDTFFIDEVFIKIQSKQHCLWRAVGQDGEVVDVFLQKRHDGKAAKRLFKRLLPKHKGQPRKIVADKLRSYNVAHRELIPKMIHDTFQYANNRAELSHEPTRIRERGMRKFKSIHQAQRFLGAYAAVDIDKLTTSKRISSNLKTLSHLIYVAWEVHLDAKTVNLKLTCQYAFPYKLSRFP